MWTKFVNKVKELGIKGILQMHLGLLCCSIAAVLFISPSKLIIGGSTGLSIFLDMLFPIGYFYYLYAINFVLILISFFLLGLDFTIKTIYGSLMLPTLGLLINQICVWTGFDIVETIADVNPVFIAVIAASLMAFGIGINMRLGGSTGGFDIIEAIFLKYFHIPYSTTIYALDVIIVVLGMIFFKPGTNIPFANALEEGLAATLYIVILGLLVDGFAFGGFNKRAVFIRSSKYEEVHDAIIERLSRGLTYLEAEGGYSLTKTKMIICICYAREYFQLRDIISQIDPNAFIFVTKATEVRGLGFNFETKEHLERRKLKMKKNKNESVSNGENSSNGQNS